MTIVSLKDYRHITKDYASTDEDVAYHLDGAQQTAERYCERMFDSAEVTERVRIRSNGRLTPSRYPVTEATAPSSVSVQDGALSLVGNGGWYDQNMLLNFPDGYQYNYPTVEVTYVGGYTVETAPYPLKTILCEIAQRALNPSQLVGVPNGATSLSSGSSSVSGNRMGGFSYMGPDIKASLDPWKNRNRDGTR